MAPWIQYLLALAALLVLAPLLAGAGRRLGSKAKSGLMLASVLLGFGAVLDQPAKQAIEATEPAKGSPETDEPPLS
jgi:hypothetical protein